jgi:TonB-dependent receptor
MNKTRICKMQILVLLLKKKKLTKMRSISLTLTIVLALFTTTLLGQDGNIRGGILDGSTGEFIPGVKVMVENQKKGAYTDIDGRFDIAITAGTYNLVVTFMAYDTVRIQNVIVEAGKVNTLDDISIKETKIKDFEDVIITGTRKTNTDIAVLSLKKKSSNMIDGVSSASIRKSGDGDAAAAMKRVPGVSLAGGKYVYIRGLGDRYNKTVLNGMDIPGLDPDRNTIQMDIFPTSVIDNLIVNKSFVASLPADFTGGIIDIKLKSFPNERIRSFSIGTAYNPNYHLRNDYLKYQGGSLDFLGFDDGTRAIPAENYIPSYGEVIGNPNGAEADRYEEILGNFNPTLTAMRSSSLMDISLGGTVGNQFKLNDKYKLGYNVVLSYKNSTSFYEDAFYGRYGLSADPTVFEMDAREQQTGDYGVNNVFASAMGGVALKSNTAKYTLNVMHLQNGESKAGIFDFYNADQGAEFLGFQHNLEYSERSLTTAQLTGSYNFQETGWDWDWRLAPTLSSIEDPDIRFTRYEDRGEEYVISSETGLPERIWRNLQERSLAGQVNARKEFQFFGRTADVKFGSAYTYKNRDFNIRNFQINPSQVELEGNPDEIFEADNLWGNTGNVASGTIFNAVFLPENPNEFNANANNIAGYASAQISPVQNLKLIVGLRSEYYTQRYTGQDQLGTNVLNNDLVLEDLGLFPSLNLVYAVNENQNVRFAYGNTTARPSFKELSYAEIFDPLAGRTFIGGLFRDADDAQGIVYWDGQLVSTDIHNFDARWEIFPTPSQIISVSAFYKKFINPIEVIQFATQAGAFQPRNVGDGEVIGGEIEVRQSLKFIAEKLQNFSLAVNYTMTSSRIELSRTEYESRVANAREGQEVGLYRDMAGQAPYIINGGIMFNGAEEGFLENLEAAVFYNVQGQTLQFAGIVDRPDIYTVPFHSLNVNASQKFGKEDNMRVGLKVSNLLNDKRESVYRSFGAEDQFFQSLGIGTTVSLKFSMNF